MSARVKREKGPDPFKDRFRFEARAYTRDPFPHTRKGEPIKSVRRRKHGVRDIEKRRVKVGHLIWK